MEKTNCNLYPHGSFQLFYLISCSLEHYRHFYFSYRHLLHKLYNSLLYDQSYGKKKNSKKKMLIANYRGSYCSHSFYILIPLIDESNFLLFIIRLLVGFFIFGGIFKRNHIPFWFFFTFLHYRVWVFIISILIIFKTNVMKTWPLTIDNLIHNNRTLFKFQFFI